MGVVVMVLVVRDRGRGEAKDVAFASVGGGEVLRVEEEDYGCGIVDGFW